jgi:hypothetical protein
VIAARVKRPQQIGSRHSGGKTSAVPRQTGDSWLRGLPVGERGHPLPVVNEELARAIRSDSSAAVMVWWGMSMVVVNRWRKALGVTRTNNVGSQRLIRAASAKGADDTRGVPVPPDQVER